MVQLNNNNSGVFLENIGYISHLQIVTEDLLICGQFSSNKLEARFNPHT